MLQFISPLWVVIILGTACGGGEETRTGSAAQPSASAQQQQPSAPAQRQRPSDSTPQQQPSASPRAREEKGAVLVGAGDIADCKSSQDEATAALLDGIEGTVFTLGDNAYPDGTLSEFRQCYDESWGRHKGRTKPSPGNHDYKDDGAAGYFEYFGEVAGDNDKGYYSYDLAAWHIIVLNSNCKDVACEAGSPQEKWLRADLEANDAKCTLAYWHHPRFSSGAHGDQDEVSAFWQDLYNDGADVVLSSHDHDYERFAPQNPNGQLDVERGIREFIVGTGGESLGSFETIRDHSEVRNDQTYGVLKLTLYPDSYAWEFMPVSGDFRDSGPRQACH